MAQDDWIEDAGIRTVDRRHGQSLSRRLSERSPTAARSRARRRRPGRIPPDRKPRPWSHSCAPVSTTGDTIATIPSRHYPPQSDPRGAVASRASTVLCSSWWGSSYTYESLRPSGRIVITSRSRPPTPTARCTTPGAGTTKCATRTDEPAPSDSTRKRVTPRHVS